MGCGFLCSGVLLLGLCGLLVSGLLFLWFVFARLFWCRFIVGLGVLFRCVYQYFRFFLVSDRGFLRNQ